MGGGHNHGRELGLKNDFEIRGDTTAIIIRRKNGKIYEALIDTEDLPRAQEFPNTWCLLWSPDLQGFYVHGYLGKENGRRIWVYLHRWLLNAPKGTVVDHINHDTLDNRRSNLRLINNSGNRQNLRGATRISSSGVRGVYWKARDRKWAARVRVNGQEVFFKLFDDLDTAAREVAKARAKYMPYSQEARLMR